MDSFDPSVPVTRTPLVVDRDAGLLRAGDRVVSVPADGDALASYLSMIYAARGVARGTKIPLRDEDVNVLAGLVGDDPAEVESRLIELMECTPEEARRLRVVLFRRRSLATAAGIALGLAALSGGGTLRLKESPGSAAAAAAPPSIVQLHDPGAGTVGPAASFALPVVSSTPAAASSSSVSSAPAGELGAFVDDPIAGLDGAPPAVDTPAADVLPTPDESVPDTSSSSPDAPRSGGGSRGSSPDDDGPTDADPVDDGSNPDDGSDNSSDDGSDDGSLDGSDDGSDNGSDEGSDNGDPGAPVVDGPGYSEGSQANGPGSGGGPGASEGSNTSNPDPDSNKPDVVEKDEKGPTDSKGTK